MINLGELQYSNICLDSSNTNDQQHPQEELPDVEIMCGIMGRLLKDLFGNFVLIVKDVENNVLFVADANEDSKETIEVLEWAIKDLEECP